MTAQETTPQHSPSPETEETALLARDLIRFDTQNWGEGRSNGEADAADYVADHLRGLGLEPVIVDAEPGRRSVIARVAGERTGGDALVVHGHLDVVPAMAEAWSVDPFAGEIRDGMLWGRGAVDMKNMDAMILTAMGDILGSGRKPARDLVLAFFSDEEDGGRRGSQYVVRERPDLFAGATEAISEVGGYSVDVGGRRAYLVQTGEKALMWLKLTARGRAGHGSQVNRENAVTRLAEAVAAVGREEWPIHLTDATRALLDAVADILGTRAVGMGPEELAIATGTASRFISASLRSTANPTMLDGGYKANVIPDTASAHIDVRTIPGHEEAVIARIRELVGEHVEVEVTHGDIGLEQPFEGSLVDAMVAELGRADPEAAVLPYLLPAGTDNKALSTLGIRGYGFAPLRLPADLDFPALFHGVDERVPLDALVFGRQVLRELLVRY
jgi:acetylornithine deacetylase/succinyl-diaminopimelate desuccinylase-like protein